MIHADRPQFAVAMGVLAEAFSKPVSDALVEVYFAALSDYELADVHQAVNATIQHEKFWPSVAVLREYMAGGDAQSRAALAWAEVRSIVASAYSASRAMFSDPCTRAAVDAFGGLDAIVIALRSSDVAFRQKEFEAVFVAVAAREGSGVKHLGEGPLPTSVRLSGGLRQIGSEPRLLAELVDEATGR